MARTYDETVTIKKDKVYSSYYARACKIIPDWRLIAISRGIPDNFGGSVMRELNPSQSLLYNYKNWVISEDEYKEIYFNETLKQLDPCVIYNKIKGKVIVCYCGKDSFCHRNLVIEWIRQNIGDEVIGGEI